MDKKNEHPADNRLREVAAAFLKLGCTAFGGPAAHVALMEEEFVHRRKWLDRRHFLDLVAAVLQRLRQQPAARGALDGMNAAICGLLAVMAMGLAQTAIYSPQANRLDLFNFTVLIISLAGLFRGINATWLILASGMAGAIR